MEMVFLIPGLILMLIGIFLLIRKQYEHLGRFLILLFPTEITAFSVFVMIAAAAETGVNILLYGVLVSVLGVLAVALIGCALWGVLNKRSVYVPLCLGILICSMVLGILSN